MSDQIDTDDEELFSSGGDLALSDLNDFIAQSPRGQLAWVEMLDIESLVKLHDCYVHGPPEHISPIVWHRMLERICPRRGLDGTDGYSEASQDAAIRMAMTPGALARLRTETYDNELVPFLRAERAHQIRFLKTLTNAEMDSLLKLIDRYTRERGRTAQTVAAKAIIAAKLQGDL